VQQHLWNLTPDLPGIQIQASHGFLETGML